MSILGDETIKNLFTCGIHYDIIPIKLLQISEKNRESLDWMCIFTEPNSKKDEPYIFQFINLKPGIFRISHLNIYLNLFFSNQFLYFRNKVCEKKLKKRVENIFLPLKFWFNNNVLLPEKPNSDKHVICAQRK